MKKFNFYSALSHCYDMYGVELDEDQFETYAMSAWHKIGNKDYKTYRMRAVPECDPDGGWYVCLPCNADTVIAVTLPYEDALHETTTDANYGAISLPTEDDIESRKFMTNELYLPGKYVKYKELGDRLYFTEPFSVVQILYKGLYADEDGLPFLNNNEVEAIAVYCAYCHFYKQGLMTKDQNNLVLSQSLKQEWIRACSNARVTESISQNAMNEILSVMTSFNRSGYGRSYKPIK